jgi:hypothetical protein
MKGQLSAGRYGLRNEASRSSWGRAINSRAKAQLGERHLRRLGRRVGGQQRRRHAEGLEDADREPRRDALAAQRRQQLHRRLRQLQAIHQRVRRRVDAGAHRLLDVGHLAAHQRQMLARRDGPRQHQLDGRLLQHRVADDEAARDAVGLDEPERGPSDASAFPLAAYERALH